MDISKSLEGNGYINFFNAIFGKKRASRGMNNKAIIFLDLIKENKTAFINELESVAKRLNIDPNWILAVMYKESRLNPQAVNKTGGATGLIQFMPNTAKGLGTSTADLYNMTNVEQLKYVEKYFKPYKDKIKSYLDLYLVTFFPVALSKPNDWYFETKNLSKEKIGIQNKGINGGNPINKIAFKNYLLKNIDPKYLQYLS
jgi:hypothetical protein